MDKKRKTKNKTKKTNNSTTARNPFSLGIEEIGHKYTYKYTKYVSKKTSSKESTGFKTLSSMYISVDSSEQDYIVFHIQIKITT